MDARITVQGFTKDNVENMLNNFEGEPRIGGKTQFIDELKNVKYFFYETRTGNYFCSRSIQLTYNREWSMDLKYIDENNFRLIGFQNVPKAP